LVQRSVATRGSGFFTVREAAAHLKVSTATLYRLVEEGVIPHWRVGNSIRIDAAALASGGRNIDVPAQQHRVRARLRAPKHD
jgi:excisionase family DNA binding protein